MYLLEEKIPNKIFKKEGFLFKYKETYVFISYIYATLSLFLKHSRSGGTVV